MDKWTGLAVISFFVFFFGGMGLMSYQDSQVKIAEARVEEARLQLETARLRSGCVVAAEAES